ncbi:hypothetical protein LCGC14_2927960, partial [marine sediment metagenome]
MDYPWQSLTVKEDGREFLGGDEH